MELKHLLSVPHWKSRMLLWGAAALVGVAAVAFAKLADIAQLLLRRLVNESDWWPWLTAPLGFAAIAWVTRRYFAGAEGSGIPQTIFALRADAGAKGQQFLRPKVVIGRVVLAVMGLLCGGSIGREGPTVHVGAVIVHGIWRWLPHGRVEAQRRALVLAGGAAGVAAAFNTPLAGIVFAIEEMGRAFEQRNAGLVLIAVILAGIASLGLVGNYDYFGSNASMLIVTIDWVAVFICGVAGGLGGALFAKLVLHGSAVLRDWVGVAPKWRALVLAGSCGLIVAASGLASHGATYGTSYEAARGAVEGGHLAWSFAPLKMIATLASTLSGIPGGFFAPTLSIGAGLGDMIADLLHVHAPGAIVLLGMTAYFAGVVQAPITSAVIIGEMSEASAMRLPLLLAALIGYGVSRFFQRESLYHAMAHAFLARQQAPKT